MEKVADQEEIFEPEVYENDIDCFLKAYCEENKIENIKTESQAVWNSCLRYIYKHVFRDSNILKLRNNINNPNGIMSSNYNSYDYDTVLKVLDIYIFDMCMKYDKEVSIIGFSTLTGINESVIYDWGNSSTKLNSKSIEIYKKLNEFREESLSNKLVTGRQNPVGVLGVLNRHYAWNLPGVSREQTEKRALTARDLPKLGTNQPEELPQNCIEIGDNSADHDT